jgi:hypothetical protein
LAAPREVWALRCEEESPGLDRDRTFGPSSKTPAAVESSRTSAVHGKELLGQGYSVDQVVHGYGDVCQAITELATEKYAPVTVDEFRTFNRLLDNAIADAVSSYGRHRDEAISAQGEQPGEASYNATACLLRLPSSRYAVKSRSTGTANPIRKGAKSTARIHQPSSMASRAHNRAAKGTAVKTTVGTTNQAWLPSPRVAIRAAKMDTAPTSSADTIAAATPSVE